jgi:hypothetical protein
MAGAVARAVSRAAPTGMNVVTRMQDFYGIFRVTFKKSSDYIPEEISRYGSPSDPDVKTSCRVRHQAAEGCDQVDEGYGQGS